MMIGTWCKQIWLSVSLSFWGLRSKSVWISSVGLIVNKINNGFSDLSYDGMRETFLTITFSQYITKQANHRAKGLCLNL